MSPTCCGDQSSSQPRRSELAGHLDSFDPLTQIIQTVGTWATGCSLESRAVEESLGALDKESAIPARTHFSEAEVAASLPKNPEAAKVFDS
ncbi:hypothetical protein NP233_g9836 [Leucocoprinus birnbaumii]|uniref:Uncharacterized protein n=1 Tax=Leucocoprinus birnbaumii TaxID=56174 RepID=A0AAD5VKD2_9AGAR|nr:hypothetical protein NP233_g9836 [Leucocoprinus birnbaumii]